MLAMCPTRMQFIEWSKMDSVDASIVERYDDG